MPFDEAHAGEHVIQSRSMMMASLRIFGRIWSATFVLLGKTGGDEGRDHATAALADAPVSLS